ncbi:MAG TPA: STAS/SEC14 domain-containing protein [Cytophagales bacterium]|nr:STAS/SEC14 domain-containing protein [Cytophagales bacterium]
MNPIVFQAPYAKVTYLPEKRTLVLIWNGTLTQEDYRKPFLAMIEFGKKTPVDSMLSDISKQGIISPENRKWFEKEMMPRAVETGLKRGAIVTSGNAFKLYYINLILSAVNKFPIATKLFNNQKDAFAWLDGFEVSTHKMG